MGDGTIGPSKKDSRGVFSNWVGVLSHIFNCVERQAAAGWLYTLNKWNRTALDDGTKSSRLFYLCVTFATPSLWLYWHHKFTFFSPFWICETWKSVEPSIHFFIGWLLVIVFHFSSCSWNRQELWSTLFCYRQSTHLTEKCAHFEFLISLTCVFADWPVVSV